MRLRFSIGCVDGYETVFMVRYFVNATCDFPSHAMGCVDVNDAVHMVRLRYCSCICVWGDVTHGMGFHTHSVQL